MTTSPNILNVIQEGLSDANVVISNSSVPGLDGTYPIDASTAFSDRLQPSNRLVAPYGKGGEAIKHVADKLITTEQARQAKASASGQNPGVSRATADFVVTVNYVYADKSAAAHSKEYKKAEFYADQDGINVTKGYADDSSGTMKNVTADTKAGESASSVTEF